MYIYTHNTDSYHMSHEHRPCSLMGHAFSKSPSFPKSTYLTLTPQKTVNHTVKTSFQFSI